VGDDNELGAVRHAAQILRIARDVYVVQRGLDLIEEAERRGVDAQDGEIDRDSDQRLLAAGKRGQVLDDLARGRYFNFNAGFQHVRFIRQVQPRMTAAEQLLENLLEVRVDLLKARREQFLHLAAQLGDHLRQLGLRLFDVGDLRLHEVIALPDLFIFVNRADVDVAQGADLAADLGHAAAQLGQALKRHALAAGLTLGQLVFLPQLAVGVVQLGLGGGAALGQAGHLAAHPLALVGQGAVVLPQLRDRSLLFEAGRVGRSNRFLRGGNFLLVVAAHALHLSDFQRVGLDFCLGGLNRRLQFAGAGVGLAGTAP